MDISLRLKLISKRLKIESKYVFGLGKGIDKNYVHNIRSLYKLLPLFYDKNGIEIGGPSRVFNTYKFFPAYWVMKACDGVNFSGNTVWTGKIDDSKGYVIDGESRGMQYIADATDLSALPAEKYDFLLSSNNIEHIANPMRAVEQWIRLLKPGGVLVVIAPRKESNFDHKRECVKFDHLLQDFKEDMPETDLTHLEEILQLHDLSMDLAAGTFEQFKERSLKNIENRCLHHHVFEPRILQQIYEYFDLDVMANLSFESDYIIIGRKK